MTRINVVPVKELSDQHLIAEYRELPRCINQAFNLKDAPKNYILGKGHVKWAASHIRYLLKRYHLICGEMGYRNFKVNFRPDTLVALAVYKGRNTNSDTDYKPTAQDLKLNRERLISRYKAKPDFYKWTAEKMPKYYIEKVK